MVVEADKDAYCEKPMANALEDAKAVRDAVRSRKQVVQIGTQHRSEAAVILTAAGASPGDLDIVRFTFELAHGVGD